jgi:uncharacterized protein (DUF2236 family)
MDRKASDHVPALPPLKRAPGADEISPDAHAATLARLRAQVVDPKVGLFGPDTVVWKVSRESVLFLGAARALLMQIAHPWVAQGVKDHSVVHADPMGRFHRTFVPVFSMNFGDAELAFTRAAQVYRVHSHIRGTMGETLGPYAAGSPYYANHPDALMWVFATLWDTSATVYERVVGPLADTERERHYQEGKRFAALFGVPDDRLPASYADFKAYVAAMCASETLAVGAAAREIVDLLFDRPRHIVTRAVPGWYRSITADLLPAPLAQAFALEEPGKAKRTADRVIRRLSTVYRFLPGHVRWVGPYQEAVDRLAGRTTPRATTRAVNLMWLGQTRLTDK